MNNNFLMAALASSAEVFVEKMKGRLSQHGVGGYPPDIESSIVTDPPQPTYIDIKVGGESALMAVAFEYGSGLYRTRGEKKEYPISPKEGGPGRLIFPISRWPKYEPPPKVKFAVFPGLISLKPFVMHPGIQPRPFVEPSLQEALPEIRSILGQGFRAQIKAGMKPVTIIEAK